MIPKLIHYVWLGGGQPTPSVVRCIDSWKKTMPDYEIKCWNEENFDINSVPWVKEAIEMRKWSLASDYIRHYAVYHEGGIYLDTDVTTYKSFDDFLKYSFFTSVEYHPAIFKSEGIHQVDNNGSPIIDSTNGIGGLGLLAAGFGAEKGNPYIKECMDYFGSRHFIQEDGSLFMDLINPAIMAFIMEKYGFKYINRTQLLDNNMIVFDASVMAGDPENRTKESYSMHWCDASWKDLSEYSLRDRLKLLRNKFLPFIYRK